MEREDYTNPGTVRNIWGGGPTLRLLVCVVADEGAPSLRFLQVLKAGPALGSRPRGHKIPYFKRSISLKIETIATAIWWECSASCFVELT